MYMIDLQLKPARLIAHASALGHGDHRDEDLGYAVHAWLRAAFGNSAPKPFRLVSGRTEAVRVLAYSTLDAQSLYALARETASPLAFEVCVWERAAAKSMDDIEWIPGRTLGFEARVAPIVRGRAGERDAFLAAISDGDAAERETVYRKWLAERLDPYVDVCPDRLRVKSFRLTSAWRQGKSANGTRVGRRVVLPDVVMEGALTIRERKAFQGVLFDGVGRHRAFGFGMLLVRPL